MVIKHVALDTVCGITSILPKNTVPEIAFADLEDDMDLAEDMLKYIIKQAFDIIFFPTIYPLVIGNGQVKSYNIVIFLFKNIYRTIFKRENPITTYSLLFKNRNF